jgi:hypothetical protein
MQIRSCKFSKITRPVDSATMKTNNHNTTLLSKKKVSNKNKEISFYKMGNIAPVSKLGFTTLS